MMLNIEAIRQEFPILNQKVNKHQLVYLDNAASSQKPMRVIRALENYYTCNHSNIHRGVHTLAERATKDYEDTRTHAAKFINAAEPAEVIFTRGTTEGINLVAQAYGRKTLKREDEILLSGMEHHSNIVPWQMVAKQTGAKIRVIPVTDEGALDLVAYGQLLTKQTKIVAVNLVSNTLGTINPVATIVEKAHAVGARVMVDAAQATPHLYIDVEALNADFLALSAHKMYGPTGVGLLYGKRALLEYMDPYQGGGEMINEVSFEETSYNEIPYKFEAGTPNIADVIAFREAMLFMEELGHDAIQTHENDLLVRAISLLSEIDGFTPMGTAENKASVISFNIEGVHPYDLGMWLDAKGIAVRTGHHCTQPLMTRFGVEGTVRASFAVYNTHQEVEQLAEAVKEVLLKLA